MVRVASEPRLASERHDVALGLALGALAVAGRFEQASTSTLSDGPSLDRDDPVLLAALGVIALSRALQRWLTDATTIPVTVADTPREAVLSSRELLR